MSDDSKELRQYVTVSGKVPFKDWLFSLRDVRARAKIISRLTRLKFGHFGDAQSVGKGVFELRIHFGPGYRVYFGNHEASTIIVLCAGDKDSQTRDIAKAQHYWQDYRGRQ